MSGFFEIKLIGAKHSRRYPKRVHFIEISILFWRIFIHYIQSLHKRIHAFIHPRVISFIRAKNALKPIVSYFVRHNHIKKKRIIRLSNDGDIWIFHPSTCCNGSINSGTLLVRIIANQCRIMIQCIVHISHCIFPKMRFRIGEQSPGCYFVFAIR